MRRLAGTLVLPRPSKGQSYEFCKSCLNNFAPFVAQNLSAPLREANLAPQAAAPPGGGGFCRNGTFCRPFGGGGGIFCRFVSPRGRPGAAAPGETARERRRVTKFTVDG